MKSTVAINLYRLSLILVIAVTSYSSVDAIRSAGHWDAGDALVGGLIFYFILMIAVISRVTAHILKANVKWWDFVALVLSLTFSDELFNVLLGRSIYGTSFISSYTIPSAIAAIILLVLTFRQSKTFTD